MKFSSLRVTSLAFLSCHCDWETKISRQELSADIAIAEGYESFFSCNRTYKKFGYSGVATFCRVGQIQPTTSPVLPIAADEGFTGLLHFSKPEEVEGSKGRVGCYEEVFKTELSPQELLRLDSEGRCLVTDHGSFVLFNIYAPRVEPGDTEREEFKYRFFRTLQRRWDGLLSKGRRVVTVGDFNIAPCAIDHCDPGPGFDKHLFRKWLSSILHAEGGPFRDVFRFIHPDRKEAYTCWSQASGAEEFNYGTRIDLIIAAGPCSHEGSCTERVNGRSHDFVVCEVLDSNILSEFRRGKNDTLPRWHGGRSLKLEGSDHAPVFVQFKEQRPVELHDVPPLAARYMPELRGRQQDLVSLLKRQPSPNDIANSGKTVSCSSPLGQKRTPGGSLQEQNRTKKTKGKVGNRNTANKQDTGCGPRHKQSNLRAFFLSPTTNAKASLSMELNRTSDKIMESVCYQETLFEEKAIPEDRTAEQAGVPSSRSEKEADGAENMEVNYVDTTAEDEISLKRPSLGAVDSGGTLEGLSCTEAVETDFGTSSQKESYVSGSQEKPDAAFEWKRILTVMARAVPLCCGHREPCVSRVVKKPGRNMGRGFYVCARAEGPSSNPEARCNHFEWSSSSMKAKGKVLGK